MEERGHSEDPQDFPEVDSPEEGEEAGERPDLAPHLLRLCRSCSRTGLFHEKERCG